MTEPTQRETLIDLATDPGAFALTLWSILTPLAAVTAVRGLLG